MSTSDGGKLQSFLLVLETVYVRVVLPSLSLVRTEEFPGRLVTSKYRYFDMVL